MLRIMRRHNVFETAAGFCGIAWSAAGISHFQLPTQSQEETQRLLLRRVSDSESASPPAEIASAITAVKRYFEGHPTDFSSFTLDLQGQNTFYREIYTAARRVGWGRTTTYGALAREAGSGPEAAREVGQALARNPVALLIPCHRVLAAGGKLGGFSAPGGTLAKMRMLELEGIRVEPLPSPQQPLF
jgi:methylated-DNA-[protein]-cysteine S-methyltransferase